MIQHPMVANLGLFTISGHADWTGSGIFPQVSSMALQRWIIAVSLTLASVYVIADLSELWYIYRQPEMPAELASYFGADVWTKDMRSAIYNLGLRCSGGLFSLLFLYWFIQNRHIASIYRFVDVLIPKIPKWLKAVLFWEWWTLVGYVYEIFGMSVNGWKVNKPSDGMVLLELSFFLATEAIFASLFLLLAGKCNRMLGTVILALVGVVGWALYYEVQIINLDSSIQLISVLQPAHAEQLKRFLMAENFPPDRVILSNIPSTMYVRSFTREAILYNVVAKYGNIREVESMILHALYERKLGMSYKTYYASNWLYYAARSCIAFSVLNLPPIMQLFGFNANATIGALAIGDFFMSNVRYASEPLWLWFDRRDQTATDTLVIQRGYKQDLMAAIYRTSIILEYHMSPIFEVFRSGRLSTKKRIDNLR